MRLVLFVTILILNFKPVYADSCHQKALALAERSCLLAHDIKVSGELGIDLKFFKLGAKADSALLSEFNLIDCIKSEIDAARNVMDCTITAESANTPPSPPQKQISSMVRLCIGESCSSGGLIASCNAKKDEQQLMQKYCNGVLGDGSRVVSIFRGTQSGGKCGYVLHDFRCEK